MPEMIPGPERPIRVPDELREAAFVDLILLTPREEEVELLFFRRSMDEGEPDEAVARVFMPRENFVSLVRMLAASGWTD